jgi:hypothetical protein
MDVNPFYSHFKVLASTGQGINLEDGIGDVYRGVLFQRGYGLGYNAADVYAMQGLGFQDVLSSLFRVVSPYLQSGLRYLGNEAVSTVANIAKDAINGENVKEAAKQRTANTAEEIYAKAPDAIARVFNKKNGTVKRRASPFHTSTSVTSLQKKRKFGRGLLREYPVLEKIG